ncbi:hypothetical protein ACIRL0_24355 [Streptomyces sp. NPDC102365]|uniref:hypothetical protein n=1 Tax=Streptomyces sp. NPDC102365 TaxID=3366162 RepID=UPI00381EEA3E
MSRSTLTGATRRRSTARRRPLVAGLLALLAASALSAVAAPAALAADAPGKAANIRQGKPVDAQPGQDWIYPAVVIKNTGRRPLGTEKLIITADSATHFLSSQLGVSRRDGQEEHVQCDLVSDDRVLICDGFDLNLAAQRYLVAYPEMGVDSDVETPTTSKVQFALGSPQFASGKAGISIHD